MLGLIVLSLLSYDEPAGAAEAGAAPGGEAPPHPDPA
jgi:hypothetical protein